MGDTKHLIAEVAARNGIRLDASDPAFCLVTLNELMLQEAATRIAEDVRLAARDFAVAAEKIQIRSGTILAQQINGALTTARQSLHEEIQAVTAETTEKFAKLHRSNAKFITYWIATGILVAAGIFAAGVLVGWAWH